VKRYFVTGTDTGVGKTFTSCALARRGVALGKRVFAYKPVETGCTGPLGEDQAALVEAAGGWQQGELRGTYQFALPAAPSVAAEAEGRTIDVERVGGRYAEGAREAELVIVEGAGGWRVPVTESVDMAGLARMLGLPVIVVGRAGLGTINHSLLTVEAVERDGCEVAALVLSRRPDEDVEFARSNAREIGRRWRGTIVVLGDDARVLDQLC
jgi:dethiobiotin synthetase